MFVTARKRHMLAALRFIEGTDATGGGTPPGDNGTPPAGDNNGTGGGDNGDRGSGDAADPDDADKGDRQTRRDETTRARLKEAEAARDGLAAKVEAYQRREVERIAGGVLAQAADLFEVGGHELAAFLDPETGEVDEGAVAAALDILATTRPGLLQGARPPARGSHPDWGHSRAGVSGIGGEGPSWRDALVRTEGSGRR
ncbi:hypothetical protein [Rhodococcus sp. IEGM 1408]|uniref:hypothetical protein n=1 Tax=Rhodococcus sp. IEGM 1408 TaxID=3082220 RepID=UPI002955C6C5|nr:hypothetical protein [Rhodococcus sp. IEGM 1408]MDV8000375.1 hypothetical protein [Rhodococcus sp. IEGM 1408]